MSTRILQIEALEPRLLLHAPEIVIDDVSYAAGTYVAGQAINYDVTLSNNSDTATGLFWIEARLSTNQVWGDGDDVIIDQFRTPGSVGAEETVTLQGFGIIPGSTPAGDYHLLVWADSAEEVAEDDELNNFWVGGSPDVVVVMAGTPGLAWDAWDAGWTDHRGTGSVPVPAGVSIPNPTTAGGDHCWSAGGDTV